MWTRCAVLYKFIETRRYKKIGRGLNDLGNAYVAAGDVSNAIDTLREAGMKRSRRAGRG